MQDISGFGLQIQVVASFIYPAGITLTQFADDADALDFPSLQIADKAMGLNGDLIVWSKANPLLATINVIANSDDDTSLGILLAANRVGRGKNSTRDIITMNAIYPDGRFVNLTTGKITDGMFGQSVASAGRLKTKAYLFAFEGIIGNI